MQGLELSESYYKKIVAPMIHEKFGKYEYRIAVGLVGHGSECFGYDDELSTDHDFDAGCCLWLTKSDFAVFGQDLQRQYALLPPDYMGIHTVAFSRFGSESKGVTTVENFYRTYTGSDGAPETDMQWLSIPSPYLAEATNGKVFRDDLGAFTAVRERILTGMPEDVRLKKIAARCAVAAQTGQYNYMRCMRRGQIGAARLALDEFVRAAADLAFLLEKKHAPYYKWIFRAMKKLSLTELVLPLEYLLTAPDGDGKAKAEIIDGVCEKVAEELRRQKLSGAQSGYLESHALSVTERIHSPKIRSLHLMEG